MIWIINLFFGHSVLTASISVPNLMKLYQFVSRPQETLPSRGAESLRFWFSRLRARVPSPRWPAILARSRDDHGA